MNGALNRTVRKPAMTPPMRTRTGRPGTSRLMASATQTEAKIAGKVGPPRKPLLNATASSASLTMAITNSSTGPYWPGRRRPSGPGSRPRTAGSARRCPTTLKTTPAARARSTSRPSNRPKTAAATPEERPATSARIRPSRPNSTTRTTSIGLDTARRRRQVQVVLEPGAAGGEEDEVADGAADEVGRQVPRLRVSGSRDQLRAQDAGEQRVGDRARCRPTRGSRTRAATGAPTGIPTLSLYIAAIFDAMPPMPPSGPSTAPENSETQAITMVTGSRPPVDLRDVAAEAVEHRLVEVRRRVGVLDQQADEQRERQADDREHPAVATTKSFSQSSLVDGLEDDQPGQHRHGADDGDDDDVHVGVDRLRGRDGRFPRRRSCPPSRWCSRLSRSCALPVRCRGGPPGAGRMMAPAPTGGGTVSPHASRAVRLSPASPRTGGERGSR